MFLTKTKSCFHIGSEPVKSTMDLVNHTQQILLIESNNHLYNNLLCPYELLKARLWNRQGIFLTEILVFCHALEHLYPESEHIFLPLTLLEWNFPKLLMENNARW